MAEGSFTIRSKVFSTVRPEAEIEKLSLLMITFQGPQVLEKDILRYIEDDRDEKRVSRSRPLFRVMEGGRRME